jgi:hypothetical protein
LLPGKCWIFPSDKNLSPHRDEIASLLDPFLRQWAAHGARVESEAALIHGHFLVVVEGIQGESSSGCSQDALRSVITQLEKRYGTPLLAGGRIFYLGDSGQVEVVSRSEFQSAFQLGKVGPDTLVFDTLVQRVADLRSGAFVLPARASWHKKILESAASKSLSSR